MLARGFTSGSLVFATASGSFSRAADAKPEADRGKIEGMMMGQHTLLRTHDFLVSALSVRRAGVPPLTTPPRAQPVGVHPRMLN